MSNREFAAGVVRAWGVMWSFYVVLSVPQLISALAHTPGENTKYVVGSSVIYLLCQIIVVVTLLAKAGWFASMIFPDEKPFGLSISSPELAATLFAVVGLYYMLDGLRHGSVAIYMLLTQRHRLEGSTGYPETLVRALAGVLGGAVVFFGLGRQRAFWRNLGDAYRKRFSLTEPADGE